ncbi:MAG: metallopeptidase family protein [Alphaproteobacteria bacterium]|nr:metallopeptidase family protein [Alphaproteobacteria bacterium]
MGSLSQVRAEVQKIIMNYTTPPTHEDLEVLAAECLLNLPDELHEYADGLAVAVEDLADESVAHDLDDPYEMIALYKSGSEISPGVVKKMANDDDVLMLFRRPLLDLWCETCDDLSVLVRQIMIEEIGRHFEFSDDEIDEMVARHFQGLF